MVVGVVGSLSRKGVMEDGLKNTLSLNAGDAPRRAFAGPCLFLVAQAHHRRTAPLCLPLEHLDKVEITRAHERRIDFYQDEGSRCARLGIVDPWISKDHATLIRAVACWKIVDNGSKNGTGVNGRK